jgi:hypothetical protein
MVLPYLKGFEIIKCGFFYISLWIYCVFSICGDYICRSIQVRNNWYQSTFQGRSCGQLFFIFADFFFLGEGKKRAETFQTFSVYLYTKFVENGYISEFLSEKHPS